MEVLGWRRHWLIWAAVVPVAVWAVIRGFGLDDGFPLVPLLVYTPYVAAAALLVAGVATALRNWAAAIVAAAATVALLAVVLPRAIGSGEDLPPGDVELRVLSANIHHGTANAHDLVALVGRLRPDVLAIQELTPGFVRRLESAGVYRYLPHALIERMRPGGRGSGVYARLPIRPLHERLLSAFYMPRLVVGVAGGRVVRIVDVHPQPPHSCCIGGWKSELESLPHAGEPGPPWILAGDFNSTLDLSQMRKVVDTGYRDAGDATGRGLEATWPQGRLLPPPVTIDHVLADRGIAILSYQVEGLPGSDHRAIFARLGVP